DIPKEAFLALLTIGDNIDAGFDLFADYVGHGLAHQPGEGLGIVGLTALLQAQQWDKGIVPCQAANVRGQDAVGTALHVSLLSSGKAAPVAASPLPAPSLIPRAGRLLTGHPRSAPAAPPENSRYPSAPPVLSFHASSPMHTMRRVFRVLPSGGWKSGNSAWSLDWPASLARSMASRSDGLGKLPAWVGGIRSLAPCLS